MPTDLPISGVPAGTPTRDDLAVWVDDPAGSPITKQAPFSSVLGLTTDADLQTSDVTTNNVSTSKHGFAPKAPNDATKYLDGTGAYSVPAGSGGGGALQFLGEQVASASATLDFTSFISASYDEYLFEFVNVIPATDAVTLHMRMSTDGGATYDSGSNYRYRNWGFAGGSAPESSNSATAINLTRAGLIGNTSTYGVIGQLRLCSPGSTSLRKMVRGDLFFIQTGAGTPPFETSQFSGSYDSTTVVNAVRFLLSSGNIASGTIRVYGVVKAGSAGVTLGYLKYSDQQAQNTAGGTFTSGAWRTRTLNTEDSDDAGLGTLASNQITLAAGTYRIAAKAPAYGVKANQARLQNVTDGTTLLLGTCAYTDPTSNGIQVTSFVDGTFTIGSSKALELQHQCNTTNTTNGFGVANNFTTEVYAVVELWKVG